MDSQGLMEAVSQALREKGKASSRRTIYRMVAKTRAQHPGATSEQAWLLFAYELGVPIAEYEHDARRLDDVGELRRRWGAETAQGPSALQTESKTRPRKQREALPKESFDSVSSPQLKDICRRDYEELRKVHRAQAHKSTMILSGGLIEGLLCDALDGQSSTAEAYYKKLYPKRKRVKWTLECLIGVAEAMGIITPGATQLSHTVRDYRNLVHPRKEITSGYKVQKQQAEIAVNMVQIVMRDLKSP
jgi:hypothetical protein